MNFDLSAIKNRFHPKWLIIALVVMFGLWLFNRNNGSNSMATSQVMRGSVVNVVEVSGNVDTSNKVDVYSTTTGVIEEIYVKNEDFVEEGQELFKVKSTVSEQEKAAAYAKYLASVQARQAAQQGKLLTQSQLEAARQGILDAEAGKSDAQYDINYGADNSTTGRQYTQNEKDSLDSAVTSAKQTFANVEKQYLEYDTKIGAASRDEEANRLLWEATQNQIVVSPIAGVVANIVPLVGAVVKPQSEQKTVDPVLSLSNFNSFTVTVPVKETDIFKIKLGQKAQVTLDVIDDVVFEGEVIKIDGIGEKVNGVVTYNVTLSLIGTDERIRPGMTALADIETEKKDDVLIVENSAIRKSESGWYVVIMRGDKEENVGVQIGLRGSQYTEIVSGLNESDVVVMPEIKGNASFGVR